MGLNKKQKKQIDLARKKLAVLQQRLVAVKTQLDDPAEVEDLKREIAAVEKQIDKIQTS